MVIDRAQNAENDTKKRFLNKLSITWVVPGPNLGKHKRMGLTLGCFKMQKVKISRWGSPKIGYYTKLSHCKRNWDFSCKIVAPRNFFVFNGDFGGFQWGNFQNSEFAYYASKSGKCIKQTPTLPFWGEVGVKKWSQFFYSGTWSPIFGHPKMGTFFWPSGRRWVKCRELGWPAIRK